MMTVVREATRYICRIRVRAHHRCILLTLVVGVGLARDARQVPQYKGTERRVVIIDGRFSFYRGDLVQNDAWLHEVYADRHGTVWSQASPTLST